MRRVTATALCLLVLAGCAGTHPARRERVTAGSARSKLAQARASHEYPSPPAPRQLAEAAALTAVHAIRSFATAYINWTAQTVAGDMRSLTARCIGQARAAVALAAAETADDYELQRGGIANHGTVEAVAPLAQHPGQYVVVTLESTTATNTTAYQGLRPAWHVALATVSQQRPGQWVVSAWQPED
jgi:hypothetical protein